MQIRETAVWGTKFKDKRDWSEKRKTWNTKEWKAGGKFILSSGFEDSIKEKRMLEREAVRAEILSDCLVVIEMAFAAVYLVVRAGFH